MTLTAETTTVASLVMNNHEDQWHGNTYLQFRRCWGNDEYLTIIIAEDAFKNKAVCPRFSLTPVDNSVDCFLINSDWLDQELDFLIECLMSLDWEKRPFGSYESITIDGINIYREDLNAKRVFNPNVLDRLKPVKKLGNKITLPTAIKLLVNGQVSCYRKYKYTDDYAADSAYNFGEGEASAMALAEKIVESPSGWWASQDGDSVTIACHHFESFRCDIVDKKLL